MLKYALVHDNIVANIINEKPEGRFYEPGLLWVPFDARLDVQEGYIHDPKTNLFSKPRKTLQEEKDILLYKINAVVDQVYDKMIAKYPKAEVNTFYRQELEAERWMRGDRRVPFLKELADTRGISVEEMVKRVNAKAEVMASILAKPFAIRQKIEDQIDASTNYEQLDEIEKQATVWMQQLLKQLMGGK